MIVRIVGRHTDRTISPEGGRHLLSLLSSDSITFHVNRDPLNVSFLAEPGMLHPVSRPLQPGIRFFQHPTSARHQHALRLACPTRRRRNWVPTFRTVDPMDDLVLCGENSVTYFYAANFCSSSNLANTFFRSSRVNFHSKGFAMVSYVS